MLHTKDTCNKYYRLKAKPLMKFKMTLTLVLNYGTGRYIHPEEDGSPFKSDFFKGFFPLISQGVFFLATINSFLPTNKLTFSIKFFAEFFIKVTRKSQVYHGVASFKFI